MNGAPPAALVKGVSLDITGGKSGKKRIVAVYVVGKAVDEEKKGGR